MSVAEDDQANSGCDSNDHQPCYIYSPTNANASVSTRLTKKRKVRKPTEGFGFRSLFGGIENSYFKKLRQELFNQAWAATDARIRVGNKCNKLKSFSLNSSRKFWILPIDMYLMKFQISFKQQEPN